MMQGALQSGLYSSAYREGWEACRADKLSRRAEQAVYDLFAVYNECRGCAAGCGNGQADVQALVNQGGPGGAAARQGCSGRAALPCITSQQLLHHCRLPCCSPCA